MMRKKLSSLVLGFCICTTVATASLLSRRAFSDEAREPASSDSVSGTDSGFISSSEFFEERDLAGLRSAAHRYRYGNPDRINFLLNPFLRFKDHHDLPHSLEDLMTGIHIGNSWYLDEAPDLLYKGRNLPVSFRNDAWYIPTSIELFRFSTFKK